MRRQPDFGRIRHVHMVGIGGIGMSSIAQVLLARGFRVSGSDARRSEVTDALVERGAIVYEGHDAAHIDGAGVVVYSSAVKVDENPETREARRRGIPLIGRPVMLAELMRTKTGIGIAGTHGKTTTTSMVGMVCSDAGFEPTVIVGGKVAAFGTNALLGDGDLIVIEADEYDRTFLRLTPVIAVVTNVEADHLDIYEDLDDIRGAFTQFAEAVPFFGAVIACVDDANVQSMLPKITRRVVTYGTARQADLRADHVRPVGTTTHFDVVLGMERLGEVRLPVPGLHNVRNALAAIAVGLELEIPFDDIAHSLERFTGVERRFQHVGEGGGITVVDDYAHHPTEIRTTLDGASAAFPERRLVLAFQPHLFSRTRDFLEDFAHAFLGADTLVLTDIFPSRERAEDFPGVTAAGLADLARRSGHRDVHHVADKEDVPAFLASITRPGDVVMTMGAGDIYRYGKAFADTLPGDTPGTSGEAAQ